MIVVVVITYLTAGMTGILVGHDILDSVLMVFLVSGTYLASGRQVPLLEEQALASVVEEQALAPVMEERALPSATQELFRARL
jgi:O-antigen ligase